MPTDNTKYSLTVKLADVMMITQTLISNCGIISVRIYCISPTRDSWPLWTHFKYSLVES